MSQFEKDERITRGVIERALDEERRAGEDRRSGEDRREEPTTGEKWRWDVFGKIVAGIGVVVILWVASHSASAVVREYEIHDQWDGHIAKAADGFGRLEAAEKAIQALTDQMVEMRRERIESDLWQAVQAGDVPRAKALTQRLREFK